jgi:hypothetical protein
LTHRTVCSYRLTQPERRQAVIARVATFEGIDIAQAQATMEQADAIVRSLVEGLSGYAGRFDLATRDGKFISITLFESEEAAAAAEQTFDETLPRELGDLFTSWGGRRTAVDRFQVVVDERA